ELVVGGDEGAGRVEDSNAPAAEARELPEADFDPVQRLGDVEAPNHDVELSELLQRLGRSENPRAGTRPSEGSIGRRAAVGDDPDTHRPLSVYAESGFPQTALHFFTASNEVIH